MKIIGRIRINKTNGQKVVTIPKGKGTEDWKEDEVVEIKRIKL